MQETFQAVSRQAASRQTVEKLSVGALVGREIEEAAHRKTNKSMTNRFGIVLILERAKTEPTSSKNQSEASSERS